jgi:hypothetical protein
MVAMTANTLMPLSLPNYLIRSRSPKRHLEASVGSPITAMFTSATW